MDKPTLELTLDLDESKALLMAVGDSLLKIGYIADLTLDDFKEMNPNLSPAEAKESLTELKDIGVKNYEHLVSVVEDLREIIEELTTIEKAATMGKIVGLDKKPLI